MVQEIDCFSRLPTRRFDSPSKSTPSARPQQSQPGQPFSNGQHGAPSPFADKGKTPMSSHKVVCFKCQQPGHFAAPCPKRSLVINDREIEEEEERDLQEQTYDHPTTEYVDEEEEFDQLAMIKLPQPPTPDLGVM